MSTRTSRTSWVEGAAGSGFDVDHLPYGVFARSGERPRVAVRIGDQVVDLSVVAAADMVDTHELFDQPTLNPFMAAGPAVWESTRAWVTGLLTDQTERDHALLVRAVAAARSRFRTVASASQENSGTFSNPGS